MRSLPPVAASSRRRNCAGELAGERCAHSDGVPFEAVQLRRTGKSRRFAGKAFRVFEQDSLEGARCKCGRFAQDSVADWCFKDTPPFRKLIEGVVNYHAALNRYQRYKLATNSLGYVLGPGGSSMNPSVPTRLR